MIVGVIIIIIVIFAVVIGVSAYNVVQTTTPAVRSLTSGKLNKAIGEAHLMLKSARRVTDNLPMKDIVHQWGNTNRILKSSNIPWKELPHWREFAQNAFRISTNMLKEHPEWARELNILEVNKIHSINTASEYDAKVLKTINNTYSKWLKQKSNAAFEPYQLRHAFGYRTGNMNINTGVASKWMGHSEATHTSTYKKAYDESDAIKTLKLLRQQA